MRFLLIFTIICLFVCNVRSTSNRERRAPQKYTTKYDNLDVDRILHSKRLIISYINCLLDKGPCSPEGRELKELLPDALSNECAKCSSTQKKQGGKVLSYILLNYRKEWEQLIKKYDPEGIYQRKYEDIQDYDYSQLEEAK